MTGITTTASRNNASATWLPNLMLLAVAVVWGTSYGVAKGALLLYPVLGFLAIRFLMTVIKLKSEVRPPPLSVQ